jgi:predicted nucleotide-binding protein
MPIEVTDVRSNAQDQIAHAARVIGRSQQRLDVFRAIYTGKNNFRTVSELAQMVNVPAMQILQRAGELASNLIVTKVKVETKSGKETAYQKDAFLAAHKDEIIARVLNPKLAEIETKKTRTVITDAPSKQIRIHNRSKETNAKAVSSTSHVLVAKERKATSPLNRIFIVHGHDEALKNETEIFLREIGLEPIILHRQPDQGQTLIEKFEKYGDVSYAFVLLTPDDMGYPKEEEAKKDADRKKEPRARQNVVFELGYFVGRLGRKRVCCLYAPGVVLPTDFSGILYKKVTQNLESVAYELTKELKAAGVTLK